jgi:hypothetical protein
MRTFVIALIAAFLMFGCVGGPAPQAPPVKDLVPTGPAVDGEACTPSSSFTGPADGTFGKDSKLTGSVTCFGGKKLELKVGTTMVAGITVNDNTTTTISFDVPGLQEGTHEVAVVSEGSTLYSKQWDVAALGNDDVSGADYDAYSFKQFRAMAFDFETPVDVGRVSLYLKRLEGRTQPGTNIMVEIREDENGEPGNLVDAVSIPITETTLSYNWIHFDFDPAADLDEGRYWVVTKVEQTESIKVVSDTVMLHYATIDRLEDGNDYTMQMDLDVDDQTGYAIETYWQPLSFDREYNIVLKSG